MVSTVRLLMYYLLIITVVLTVAGMLTDTSNLIFFGKITMIASALFFAADAGGKKTIREMANKF